MKRHHGHRHGGFAGFGPPFGPPFGGPFAKRGPGGGGRARRGNVRAAILALLAERPMHGYEIIQELDGRTQGIWRPSAGSVYPTLQLLEDEGLIAGVEREGKRAFSLTDAGRAHLEEHRPATAPWDEVLERVEPGAHQLREAAVQLAAAVGQVLHAGSAEQQQRVAEILSEARRRVYGLLAEEADPG
ncbi:MAG TPA: PadR family transcriptional regulator [Acidimicrobiales bacterium]|nr:PadR family transcriptional regulator [Acidimicrobiales bacterium]